MEGTIGYITALINAYSKDLKTVDPVTRNFKSNFIKDLKGLIDFATREDQNFSLYNDLESSFKKVKELAESCKNDSEIIRNLHNKIKEIKADNVSWQKACISLKKRNEQLEAQIEELRDSLFEEEEK